jgi:hypothetical protein
LKHRPHKSDIERQEHRKHVAESFVRLQHLRAPFIRVAVSAGYTMERAEAAYDTPVECARLIHYSPREQKHRLGPDADYDTLREAGDRIGPALSDLERMVEVIQSAGGTPAGDSEKPALGDLARTSEWMAANSSPDYMSPNDFREALKIMAQQFGTVLPGATGEAKNKPVEGKSAAEPLGEKPARDSKTVISFGERRYSVGEKDPVVVTKRAAHHNRTEGA